MAADESTPSGSDDEFLEGLRAVALRADPEPRRVRAGALAAFSWLTIDAELATLTSHTAPTARASGDREAPSPPTGGGGGLTVHLQIDPFRRDR